MAKRKLTDKRERFCCEYLIDLNATQAAKRAKFSKKTAYSTGHDLLKIPEIQKRIAELQKKLSKDTGVTPEKVIREFAKVAFANIEDFIQVDNEIVDLSQLDRNTLAAVESIQTDTRHDSGDSEGYTDKVRFKLHDKIKALENLGKHLGLYEQDNKQRENKLIQIVQFGGGNGSD